MIIPSSILQNLTEYRYRYGYINYDIQMVQVSLVYLDDLYMNYSEFNFDTPSLQDLLRFQTIATNRICDF